jgi:hypothetical protein
MVAGVMRPDVLAVLHHSQHSSSSTTTTSLGQPYVVTLLSSPRASGHLEALLSIPGAAALLVPPQPGLGLLSTSQQQQQQQWMAAAAVASSTAPQLAAVILLADTEQIADNDGQDVKDAGRLWGLSSSLGSAWQQTGSPGLPGGVLALLGPQEPAPAAPAGPQGGGQPCDANANELQGLQVMLSALGARWQAGVDGCSCFPCLSGAVWTWQEEKQGEGSAAPATSSANSRPGHVMLMLCCMLYLMRS